MATPNPGTYTPQTQAELPRRVLPQAPNTSIASGLSAIAGAVGEVGQVMQAKARADAATFANDRLTDLRVQTQAAFEQAKNNAKDGADGFTAQVLGDYDRDSGQVLGQGKAKPLANAALQAGVKQLRANLAEQSISWEAQQGVLYRATSVANNTQKLATVVQNDPSQLHVSIEQQLLTLNHSNLPPATRLKLAQDATDTLTRSAATGLAKQDPFGVLEQLKDPSKASEAIAGLDIDDRAALDKFASAQGARQLSDGIVGTYRDKGPQAGQAAFAALDKMNVSDDIKGSARQEIQVGLQELQYQRRQQNADTLIGMEERIAAGLPGPNERAVAASLYQKSALSPEQYASNLASIDRAEMKQAEDEARLETVQKAYVLGTPLDPKSDGKDVNDLFNAFTQHVQPGTAEWINRGVDIAAKTGVLPSTAVDWARANLVSGNAEQASQAAKAIERLQTASPRGASFTIDEKTNALSDTISTMTASGAEPNVAVEVARNNAKMADTQGKLLDEKFKKLKPADTANGSLQKLLKSDPHFDTGLIFSNAPAIPLGMTAEFSDLTRNYFDYVGGDLAQARKLAAQDLKKTWGVTTVNGQRELMKYAPEAVITGLTGDMVRLDIEKAVPGKVGIKLSPSDKTESTHGVSWNLVAPNEYGRLDIIYDSNHDPLEYVLPGTQSGYDLEKKKAIAEHMTKARQKQAMQKMLAEQLAIGPAL